MTGSVSLAAQASQTLRFAAGLAAFLRTPLTGPASHDLIARNLTARTANFLTMVERAVYRRPHSPYRRLIAHAGIELGDLRAMVAAEGLEGTLEQLYDAGVHVRLDEFKGRVPIRRGSLEFDAGSHDFDNPLAPITSRAGPGARAAPARGSVSTSPTMRRMPRTSTACWKRMSCWVGPTRSGVLHRPGRPG